jgi:hypothetical protein
MQDIQTVSIAIATIGLLVGIIYHIISLRNATQTRQAQLYMQFMNIGMDNELIKDLMIVNEWVWKDMEEFSKVVESVDARAKFSTAVQYYNGMSIMVKENLIKLEMIPELLDVSVQTFWKKYQPLFGHSRRFDKIEYLCQEIQKAIPQRPSQ